MPERHALIIGNVTDRYPLIVKVGPLPADVPPTGRTRSTWDRFQLVATDSFDEEPASVDDEFWSDADEPPF